MDLLWDRCDRSLVNAPVYDWCEPTSQQACALRLDVKGWSAANENTLFVASAATADEWDKEAKEFKQFLAVVIKKHGRSFGSSR